MTDLNERTLGVAKEYALCITSEDGKRFCIDYDGSTADSTMTPDEGALIFARCVGPRLAALPRTDEKALEVAVAEFRNCDLDVVPFDVAFGHGITAYLAAAPAQSECPVCNGDDFDGSAKSCAVCAAPAQGTGEDTLKLMREDRDYLLADNAKLRELLAASDKDFNALAKKLDAALTASPSVGEDTREVSRKLLALSHRYADWVREQTGDSCETDSEGRHTMCHCKEMSFVYEMAELAIQLDPSLAALGAVAEKGEGR